MPIDITFAVKIVRLKVYMTIASPMTLTFIPVRLKLDYFSIFNISDNISAITSKHGMTVDLYMTYMLLLVSMTLTLM